MTADSGLLFWATL